MIIIAAILAMAASVLFIINKTKKSSKTTPKTDTSGPQNVPTLPEAQVAVAPDLGDVKKNTQDELKNVQQKNIQISEKIHMDQSGRIIVLDDFVEANEIKIESGVLQSSSQRDYFSFSCAETKEKIPAVGLMLQLRRDVDPKKYQQSYSEMDQFMKQWEASIFQDLSPLFFPGELFHNSPRFVASKYTTTNGVNIVEIRYANLTADSGKQYSIDWGFLNDQIYISNNRDCLRRELDGSADEVDQ